MTQTRYSLTIDPTATVNEILARHPMTVATFNQFGIDACCGGNASLEEAARRDGADPEALMAALVAVIRHEGDAR